MAKKKVKSDFEDMKNKIDESFEFDDEDFGDIEEKKQQLSKNKNTGHKIFFLMVIVVLAICVISLFMWNRGQRIEIDPNEDTSEFDTEPNDYIQPMTNEQMQGKPEDGILTILTLGNSPFADNGDSNYLCSELAAVTKADMMINASIPDSYQSRTSAAGDLSNPVDGISLYDVVSGLVNGDVSNVISSAESVSEQAYERAQRLQGIDLSTVDCIVISYDLNDYIDHRNIYNPYDENDVATFSGALSASVKLLQERYPYIRIVVLSAPACGKTIDDYYVDATIIDLANGTLNDYLGSEVATCATCGVSFIDLYFGVINVDTRDKYLVDDYHINEAGAKAVAERFDKLIKLN
ncbi:MAG: SGNH/GDSL hydrolase family protein [Lachnospiraceae bacterium]|nr:SGNH/GDSL hydrolase family protein [Lachnospiraceae bacterium]